LSFLEQRFTLSFLEQSSRHCGHEAHADINAACNVRAKAIVMWPKVSEQLSHRVAA
jgi:transposase